MKLQKWKPFAIPLGLGWLLQQLVLPVCGTSSCGSFGRGRFPEESNAFSTTTFKTNQQNTTNIRPSDSKVNKVQELCCE